MNIAFNTVNEQMNAVFEQTSDSIKPVFEGLLPINGKDGKSAYEIAVGNGFEGTEQEWLDSLQGEPGVAGKDGADGYTPVKGKDYFDGVDGSDGQNGEDGRDGVSPNVTVQPIAGGNRVTVTDATGSKTFDVMDGQKGEPGVNAENDELFIVRTIAGNKTDKTVAEIRAAVAAGKVCILLDRNSVPYQYRGEEKASFVGASEGDVPTFGRSATSKIGVGIRIYDAQISAVDGIMRSSYSNPAKTPNPCKLTFTGAASGTYDGSQDLTVNIPEGGVDEGQLDQAVQEALQEAKDSGLFDGKDGQDGVSPDVKVEAIAGGHRITITDASGSKTVDVMDGEKGDQGDTSVEVVAFSRVNNVLQCSHKYRDLQNIRESKILIATYRGNAYLYFGQDGNTLIFASAGFKYATELGLANQIIMSSDESVAVYNNVTIKAPNPFKLKLTGAATAEYDGSADVTVEIPAGTGGGGTGLPTGGEPHQMLVTDAEGAAKWEDRTHYSATREVTVLPECNLTPMEDMDGSALVLEPLVEDIIDGKTYTVYWNGTAYECTAALFEEDGESIWMLGNYGLLMDEESTGEPFIIGCASAEQGAMVGYYAMILPLDGSTDITIKIDLSDTTVKKLDPKYLPTPNWNAKEGEEGYIENRTHYTQDIGTIAYDSSLTYDVTLEFDNGIKLCKISDYFITESMIQGSLLYYTENGERKFFAGNNSFQCVEGEGSLFAAYARNDTVVYIVSEAQTTSDFLGLPLREKGTYIYTTFDGFEIEVGTAVYKLNRKYMPTEYTTQTDVRTIIGAELKDYYTKEETETYVQNYINEQLLGGAW